MSDMEQAKRIIHGKKRVHKPNGESYSTWGPDNSYRAINLRKKMFK